MTFSSIAAMFIIMILLAAVPDASAVTVVARSLASGFKQGFVTTLGIVLGDVIFILLAVYGLSAIAEQLGDLFIFVKYLGSAYLIWFGFVLWRSKTADVEAEESKDLSWKSNFMCGLFITLGDPKAILFYMSFLPAFVDLSLVTIFDIGLIMLLATFSVGIVKLSYAAMAIKVSLLFKSIDAKRKINRIAGSIMVVTGLFLAVKT